MTTSLILVEPRLEMVFSVAAKPAEVLAVLADIEALPRWAGGFCERVELRRGRWLGLTALGELWLEAEADAETGSVTLRAGWEPEAWRRVTVRVVAGPDGGARLVMSAADDGDFLTTRLAMEVGAALSQVATSWCPRTFRKISERGV